MNYLRLIIMMFLFSYSAQAQNINISSTAGNNLQSFHTTEGRINVQGNSIEIQGSDNSRSLNRVLSWSLSPDANRIGIIRYGESAVFELYNTSAIGLLEKNFEYIDPEDSSLKIYQFNNGNFVVRDNISNFSFYNVLGTNLFTISNLSGSPLGETISELQSSESGSTVLIYNPTIKYENSSGSRARIVHTDGEAEIIYDSNERIISNAMVSKSGSYIILHTKNERAEDQVIIFDRFGNGLFDIDSPEDLIGVSIDEEGKYLTLFSSNRVQVYNIDTADRIASSTFRSSIIYAEYQADDNQILALSGSKTEGKLSQISDIELHAIHTEKRQIASNAFSGRLAMLSSDRVTFHRVSSNNYELRGLNRRLQLETVF